MISPIPGVPRSECFAEVTPKGIVCAHRRKFQSQPVPSLYTSQTSWKLPDKPTSNTDYSTPRRSNAEAGSCGCHLKFQFRAMKADVVPESCGQHAKQRDWE